MSEDDEAAAALYDFHLSMLVDGERVDSFLRALLAEIGPRDIVVDIGAGTGVLSMFAARAGARHVYAIEEGPIGAVAARAVESNGLADRITVVKGRSTEVELPQRGTVLVSETIGNVGIDEGITTWVRDARERLLTTDARIIPRSIGIVAAPVEAFDDHGDLSRWKHPLRTVDLSELATFGFDSLLWTELSPGNLIAEQSRLIEIDLGGRIADHVTGSARFLAQREGVVHGLGVWFNAELIPGLTITNGPPSPAPSWMHGYLPIPEAFDVAAGDEIDATVHAAADGSAWAWTVTAAARESAGGSTRTPKRDTTTTTTRAR